MKGPDFFPSLDGSLLNQLSGLSGGAWPCYGSCGSLAFLLKKNLKIVECPRHSWGCHFLPFSFINGLIPFDSPVLLRGTWEGLFIAFGRHYLSPPPHPNAYLLPASRANLWVSPPLGFPLQLLFSLGFLGTSTAVCGIMSSPGHLTTRSRTLR